jgi:ribonuclease-3
MIAKNNSIHKTNYMNEGILIKKDDGTEEVIQIPYNLNNRLIKQEDILEILDRYNVTINNEKIEKLNNFHYIQTAFTHKSYCKKKFFSDEILKNCREELNHPNNLLELQNKSYETLEYLGDRVLKLAVSTYLFKRYPNEDEGFMTRLQTKLEDKTNLALMSKEIGLGRFFIISKQIESLNGRNLDRIHEDCFEAFIGALYLSCDSYEPCLLLIINLLETLIDYSDKLYNDNNYKDRLLRYHHEKGWKTAKYHMIHTEGPPHQRKFIMGIENPIDTDEKFNFKNCIAYGVGKSKKAGEQNAAKMALIIYGLLNKDQYNSEDIYYPSFDKIESFDGVNGIFGFYGVKEEDTEESEEELINSVDEDELTDSDLEI